MQARVVSIHLTGYQKHVRLIERGLRGHDYWCCPDAVLHGNKVVAKCREVREGDKKDDPKMSCRANSLFFPL